jgi:hypothetical protein
MLESPMQTTAVPASTDHPALQGFQRNDLGPETERTQEAGLWPEPCDLLADAVAQALRRQAWPKNSGPGRERTARTY